MLSPHGRRHFEGTPHHLTACVYPRLALRYLLFEVGMPTHGTEGVATFHGRLRYINELVEKSFRQFYTFTYVLYTGISLYA